MKIMFTLDNLYWILGALGIIYNLGSLFGGDTMDLDSSGMDADLDIDDADDSPKIFSFRLLFGGFLGFAIGGGISSFNGWGVPTQLIVGAVSAVFFGFLAFYLAKFMYSLQGDSSVSTDDVVGKSGTVTVRTGDTGKAMVKVSTGNGPQEFLCTSTDKRIKLKVGETVQVDSRLGGELVVSRIK